MKLSEKVLLSAFVIVIIGGAFFYFRDNNGSDSNSLADSFKVGNIFGLGGNKSNIPDIGEGEPVKKEDLKESYKAETGDFSFKYEEGMKATSSLVEGGEMITVEKDADHGFQVFILPFDEEGPITEERIREDLPDIEIREPKYVEMDGNKSLAFYSSGDLGETFEVWAVHDGKLYQIMARKNQERWTRGILGTWEWK